LQYNNSKYQALYDFFNERLFDEKLPFVIWNSSRKSHDVGFFGSDRWTNKKNNQIMHEISINPVYNGLLSFERLCSTLVHEQTHLWQQAYGKPSRSGYHNKEWGDKMESIGLIPSDTGETGGKRTGQRMTHYIVDGGVFQKVFNALPKEIALSWIEVVEDVQPNKPD
jgi:hypothetical protein